MKFRVGDNVKVVKSGYSYTSYVIMFRRLNFRNTNVNPSINFGYNVNNRNENHSIIPILGLNFNDGAVNKKIALNYGILFKSKVSELMSIYYGYSDLEKIRVGVGITLKR